MEIENLIDGANEKLYQSVIKHFDVVLEENQDWRAEAWNSCFRGNTVCISYCPTSLPNVAFAHELLHIDVQIKGYKRILHGISLKKEVQEVMQTIIKCLDNDFQHHKMAKKFLAMGYPPEQFYDDNGSGTANFLKDQLKEKGRSTISLSLLYMSFIQPLMGMKNEENQYLKKKFMDYEGGKFKQTFESIDEILHKWTMDENYDAESYMINLLKKAGVKDTWISYKHDLPGMYENEFPVCGFFVEKRFTLDEIKKVYGD